ncbi:MAG: hypothetical protein V3W37_04360 [Candidatus Binatia bacterium]
MGHRRTDRSYAQILVETKLSDVLDQSLARVREHGDSNPVFDITD